MDKQPKNSFDIIKTANQEMLDYFNDAFLKQLEEIQSIKTQAFEIDIKIDELEKTKDLYSFKSNSRKSVFTPIINDGADVERGRIIENQIDDLSEVKISLNTRLRTLEHSLNILKKRLSILNDAEAAINEITDLYSSMSNADSDYSEEGFEFIEQEPVDSFSTHGCNILMQDAFDKAFLATLLDKNIKDGLVGINNKLEMISYLLGTDVGRAKLTLQEIIHNSKQILDSINDIENKLDYNIDSTKSIWAQLDDLIMQLRDIHPECIIDANINCNDYELNIHPVYSINTIKLINIFMDNIFKHANANQIDLDVCISSSNIDVCISDNGIGISSDYMSKSPWYSSIHKAKEIVYLLEGSIDISGDLIDGTKIKFNIPIK